MDKDSSVQTIQPIILIYRISGCNFCDMNQFIVKYTRYLMCMLKVSMQLIDQIILFTMKEIIELLKICRMLDLVRGLKNVVKLSHVQIDSSIFRLHYTITGK